MNLLPKFSISQPVLVNMAVILAFIAGIFSFSQMTKEEWPDIGATHAQINASFPGASPREVEKLVIVPIEERIEAVQEIKSVTAVASEGTARMFVEFNANVSDYDLRLQELQREVGATPDLPADVDDPTVTSFRFGNSEVLALALRGDVEEHVFQQTARKLRDSLRRIPGVERVDVSGERDREVWVEVDPHAMHSYDLSLQDIIGTLQRANQNVSGGTVESGSLELLVRTVGEVTTVDELGRLVVKRGDHGEYVYLEDVASVTDTYAEALRLSRINGRRSITLEVHKIVGGDSLKIVQAVQLRVEKESALLAEGLDLIIFDNTAENIQQRLSYLYNNGALALGLVLVCLYVFVGPRPALMTALGIPFAVLLSFVIMNMLGMTINSIVLFSLIVALGLIVDDSIVITENVYRYYEAGETRTNAVLKGVGEVFWPVVAAVMTTIAAFSPLLMMTGWLGKYMAVIPTTVIIALVCSLIECLFVLPSHLYDFPPRRAQHAATHHEDDNKGRRRWLRNIRAAYAHTLRSALRLRYFAVLVLIVLAFFANIIREKYIQVQLFGGRDAEGLDIQFDVQEGTKLASTEKAAAIVEATALDLPKEEYELVFSNVGTRGWGPERAFVSNAGTVYLDLVHYNFRNRSSADIMTELRNLVEEYGALRNVIFREEYDGPGTGDAVQLEISGPNFDTLREISGKAQAILHDIPGVTDIRDSLIPGKEEVQIVVNEEKAHNAGLDLQTVANTARAALYGVEATTYYDEDEDIPVRVRYRQSARTDFTDLGWLELVNDDGQRVPFTNVAHTERRPGMARIYRYKDERTVIVRANADESLTSSLEINGKLKEQFTPLMESYPDYVANYGGENEDTNESVASLGQAFIIGLVLMYMILGTQFKSFIQPIVVLGAIPFSLIGVILGFWVLDTPLGMMSLIGVVALSGIVVNDSLILVDFVNRSRAKGEGKRESVVRAGMVRMRPILLTTTTTVAGLLPLAVGLFGDDDFLKPMAISMSCGLMFATVLTLIYIPVFYVIVVDDIQPRLERIARWIFRMPPTAPDSMHPHHAQS